MAIDVLFAEQARALNVDDDRGAGAFSCDDLVLDAKRVAPIPEFDPTRPFPLNYQVTGVIANEPSWWTSGKVLAPPRLDIQDPHPAALKESERITVAPCVQAQLREVARAQKAGNIPGITVRVLEHNLTTWYFQLSGLRGVFDGGKYIGWLQFPGDFPKRGPFVGLMTPNGITGLAADPSKCALPTGDGWWNLCLTGMTAFNTDAWGVTWDGMLKKSMVTWLLAFVDMFERLSVAQHDRHRGWTTALFNPVEVSQAQWHQLPGINCLITDAQQADVRKLHEELKRLAQRSIAFNQHYLTRISHLFLDDPQERLEQMIPVTPERRHNEVVELLGKLRQQTRDCMTPWHRADGEIIFFVDSSHSNVLRELFGAEKSLLTASEPAKKVLVQQSFNRTIDEVSSTFKAHVTTLAYEYKELSQGQQTVVFEGHWQAAANKRDRQTQADDLSTFLKDVQVLRRRRRLDDLVVRDSTT